METLQDLIFRLKVKPSFVESMFEIDSFHFHKLYVLVNPITKEYLSFYYKNFAIMNMDERYTEIYEVSI